MRFLALEDLLDALRRDLGLQHQLIAFGHNHHQRLGRRYYTTFGVDHQLVNHAGNRCLDHHAVQARAAGQPPL